MASGVPTSSSTCNASVDNASPVGDGVADAECRPHRRAVTAFTIDVDHVVVQQRDSCGRARSATAPGTPTSSSAPTAAADSNASAARTCLPPPASAARPSRSTQPRWYSAGNRSSGDSRATAAAQCRRDRGAGPIEHGGKSGLHTDASSVSVTAGEEVTARAPQQDRCVPPPPSWPAIPCRSTSPARASPGIGVTAPGRWARAAGRRPERCRALLRDDGVDDAERPARRARRRRARATISVTSASGRLGRCVLRRRQRDSEYLTAGGAGRLGPVEDELQRRVHDGGEREVRDLAIEHEVHVDDGRGAEATGSTPGARAPGGSIAGATSWGTASNNCIGVKAPIRGDDAEPTAVTLDPFDGGAQ